MLIGVLAQVEASLAPFLRPSEPEGEDRDEAGPGPARAVAARTAAGREGAGQEDDLGVAISREELDGDGEEGEEGEAGVALGARSSSPTPAGRAPPKEKRREKGELKGKKRFRAADDPGSSRICKPDKTTRSESSRDEKKVKKKKKKKGGDEFDDLFSSLM